MINHLDFNNYHWKHFKVISLLGNEFFLKYFIADLLHQWKITGKTTRRQFIHKSHKYISKNLNYRQQRLGMAASHITVPRFQCRATFSDPASCQHRTGKAADDGSWIHTSVSHRRALAWSKLLTRELTSRLRTFLCFFLPPMLSSSWKMEIKTF